MGRAQGELRARPRPEMYASHPIHNTSCISDGWKSGCGQRGDGREISRCLSVFHVTTSTTIMQTVVHTQTHVAKVLYNIYVILERVYLILHILSSLHSQLCFCVSSHSILSALDDGVTSFPGFVIFCIMCKVGLSNYVLISRVMDF